MIIGETIFLTRDVRTSLLDHHAYLKSVELYNNLPDDDDDGMIFK